MNCLSTQAVVLDSKTSGSDRMNFIYNLSSDITHLDLSNLTYDQLLQELESTHASLQFRASGGSYNLGSIQYQSMKWWYTVSLTQASPQCPERRWLPLRHILDYQIMLYTIDTYPGLEDPIIDFTNVSLSM